MTQIVSDADTRASKRAVANASLQLDPEAAEALRPWPMSRRGNPWFAARGWLFVALAPRWGRSSWRLWIEGPMGKGRNHSKTFATLEALQRKAATFLAGMPKPAR